MSKLTLGTLPPEDTNQIGRRDAFHAPCILVTANEDVEPGDNVKFEDESTVVTCSKAERQGVADPLIDDTIIESQPFWVMLMPNSTANLTHQFKVRGIDSDFEEETAPTNVSQAEVDRLRDIESRFEGYDDALTEACRGCY
jgi:hypothetical protein